VSTGRRHLYQLKQLQHSPHHHHPNVSSPNFSHLSRSIIQNAPETWPTVFESLWISSKESHKTVNIPNVRISRSNITAFLHEFLGDIPTISLVSNNFHMRN
jgi:hypothetical protein